jgi:oligopeptide transport system ATP-binding protein
MLSRRWLTSAAAGRPAAGYAQTGGLAGAAMSEPLLEVRELKKHFPIMSGIIRRPTGWLKAVDGVSFQVRRGETLGIVGESGCGKTTLGRVILRLLEPTSGEVLKQYRPVRRDMQIIFQDPFASLHPRLKVGRIITEPLAIHGLAGRRERRERARELIRVVGLDPLHLDKYPHEFSGGQQQRIVIARALSLHPALVICDEPVSSLDVSIQSQILNLLKDLQSRFGLTYVFISHNLAVVRHISEQVGVMYLGQLVELAPVEELYGRPLHPYTQALFSAIPVADPKLRRERILLSGDVPSPVDIPPGCRFAGRCRHRMRICEEQEPRLTPREAGGHFVRCHLYGELAQ